MAGSFSREQEALANAISQLYRYRAIHHSISNQTYMQPHF